MKNPISLESWLDVIVDWIIQNVVCTFSDEGRLSKEKDATGSMQ